MKGHINIFGHGSFLDYHIKGKMFIFIQHLKHNSPGKLAFFKKLIATEIILPQCIFIRSLDQHTKSPEKSRYGKYANLHKSNMAANKWEMAVSQQANHGFKSWKNLY